MADPEAPEADASFESAVFGMFSSPVPPAAADDGELQDAQGKGVEQQTLRAGESVAVILWDEPNTGSQTRFPKNDGNSLITIRYTGHAR